MVGKDCCIGWYDHCRLWAVSPHTLFFSRELDLVAILGNRENLDECFGPLRSIDHTDFNQIPPTCRESGEIKDDSEPGRVNPEGDLLYFDPFARCFNSEADSNHVSTRKRSLVPEGFKFDTDLDGQVGTVGTSHDCDDYEYIQPYYAAGG